MSNQYQRQPVIPYPIHLYPKLIGTTSLVVLMMLFTIAAALYAKNVQAAPRQESQAPFATIITVDTSADLDSGSLTTTCTYDQGALFNPAVDGCTLRRALLEAAARPDADRPIAIQFNLPITDANANLEVPGTWTLPIEDDLPVLKTPTILNILGNVTIDGSTQPGGRTDGPKIIINTNDWSLEVESEGNTITNLAFKGGGVIFLKEDNNTVKNIWMGLSDDGQEIFFRTPGQPMRMAGGGVFISSDNNLVEGNTIAGAFAKAVDISGNSSNNVVQNNQIGTRADGTVPPVAEASQCMRSLSLDLASWYGGWGIALNGSNNQILSNRIAGLHIVQSDNDTPPMAIEIFGSSHTIRDNIIGVDGADREVGVCGQGIKTSGNNTQIINNIIVGSRAGFEDDAKTAIMASDTSPLFGEITVRGNIVKDGPGNVYQFGPGIPDSLRTFDPAKITNINGTTVTGTASNGSPCPGCLIDFYLDDDDLIGEALEHLGSTTADASGNFTFALAQPLAAGMGIRTSSTTQSSGVISGFGAGTTTKISKLYLALTGVTITGPITGTINTTYAFSITVTPTSATAPFNYSVAATDAQVQTLNGSNSTAIIASYAWPTPGVKTIEVTVENDLGTVTDSIQITITAPTEPEEPADSGIYLPMLGK